MTIRSDAVKGQSRLSVSSLTGAETHLCSLLHRCWLFDRLLDNGVQYGSMVLKCYTLLGWMKGERGLYKFLLQK